MDKVKIFSVEMKLFMFCMFLLFCTFSSACTQKEISPELNVLCCHNKMAFLEAGVVVYETTTVEYPCSEVSSDESQTVSWVALLSVGALRCVCCWPFLLPLV